MVVQRVDITQDVPAPVEAVFARLTEHEDLGPLFGAKITRVRDGDTDRNGVGSVRRLRVAVLPPFEETVTEFVPGQLVGYRITQGSPLRDHRGEMQFISTGPELTRVRYVIEFGAVVPGLDRLVRLALNRSVAGNLTRVALGRA